MGSRARRVRLARGFIQEEVAERVGVSAEFYARIERGHALPSVRTFCRLVAILDVSADSLLGLEDLEYIEPLPSGEASEASEASGSDGSDDSGGPEDSDESPEDTADDLDADDDEAPPRYRPRGSRQERREKKLARRLRTCSPRTLRLVGWVLRELDRAARSPR